MGYVDVNTAAHWWQVTPHAVRRWIRVGKLTNHAPAGRPALVDPLDRPFDLDGRRTTAA